MAIIHATLDWCIMCFSRFYLKYEGRFIRALVVRKDKVFQSNCFKFTFNKLQVQ